MDNFSGDSTAKFTRSIAQFGDKLCQIVHNYDTVEEPRCDKLSAFLVHLGASVHVLNQVAKLLQDQAALPAGQTTLLSKDGCDYVDTLAEEFSVTICRARSIFDKTSSRGRGSWDPKRWETFTSLDDKGQRTFNPPALDEIECFRQLTDIIWYNSRIRDQIIDVNLRLEKLHLLLLLVVQVATIRDLTNKAYVFSCPHIQQNQ
jgi:hypothetical protein